MAIQEQANQILELVKTAGAKGDLIIDQGKSLSLKAREGELEEYKVSSSQILGLRVIKDGKAGTAYSEATDADALKSLVEQALLNASFAASDSHESILAYDSVLHTNDKILCPDEEVGVDAQIDFALALESELAAKSKVKNVPYNGVQDNTGERHIFSSAGLSAYSKGRMCAAYAYALVEDGEKNAMDGVGQAARLFKELDLSQIAMRTHENCLGLLEGTPVESGRYDVIFDDETQVQLFHTFSLMFSGKSAKDGVNPMREKVGQSIADGRLSIFDRPLNSEGFAYALFDSEGTATQSTPLISNGTLSTLTHNSATASFFGLSSTGHATRGPKSTMGVGLHQLEISPGEDEAKDLFSGEYLLLTNLTGLHSGANAISGNFSFGASGYLCQNGERIRAVRGITVAGNFYDMLQKIKMIGDQQHWNWERTALMPPIRFTDIAISG